MFPLSNCGRREVLPILRRSFPAARRNFGKASAAINWGQWGLEAESSQERITNCVCERVLNYLFAILENLDFVGSAGGLVVEVGHPLAGLAHVLVVEESADGVAGLLGADHGHHGIVRPLLLLQLRRGLKWSRKESFFVSHSAFFLCLTHTYIHTWFREVEEKVGLVGGKREHQASRQSRSDTKKFFSLKFWRLR